MTAQPVCDAISSDEPSNDLIPCHMCGSPLEEDDSTEPCGEGLHPDYFGMVTCAPCRMQIEQEAEDYFADGE